LEGECRTDAKSLSPDQALKINGWRISTLVCDVECSEWHLVASKEVSQNFARVRTSDIILSTSSNTVKSFRRNSMAHVILSTRYKILYQFLLITRHFPRILTKISSMRESWNKKKHWNVAFLSSSSR
jgi:hypothetical protein